MGNNQSVSPNSTGFVNPYFITVPDHSLFDDDRGTGRTWALAFKINGIKITIITMECNIYILKFRLILTY